MGRSQRNGTCSSAAMQAIVMAAACLAALPAGAADVGRGAELFERCSACHAVGPTTEKLPGPSLVGVVGRRAGQDASFADYSPAMRAAGQAGVTWDDDKLMAYLDDPQAVVPGGFMARPPLRTDADRADVVAYLKTFVR